MDEIANAIQERPKNRDFLLNDHEKIISSLSDINITALSSAQKLTLFSYVRYAVYEQAKQNGSYQEQDFDTEWGIIPIYSIKENDYPREIRFLVDTVGSLDYSDALKERISKLTERIFDDLFDIEDFRSDFSGFDSFDGYKKQLVGEAFLDHFVYAANEIFPFNLKEIPFYYLADHINTTFACFMPDNITETLSTDGMYIVSTEENVSDLTAVQFFYMLFHEGIHNLLAQMALAYKNGNCNDTVFQDDANLTFLRLMHKAGDCSLLPSVYFEDCEEKLCYRNQNRAYEKMQALTNPTRLDAPKHQL